MHFQPQYPQYGVKPQEMGQPYPPQQQILTPQQQVQAGQPPAEQKSCCETAAAVCCCCLDFCTTRTRIYEVHSHETPGGGEFMHARRTTVGEHCIPACVKALCGVGEFCKENAPSPQQVGSCLLGGVKVIGSIVGCIAETFCD